MKTTGVIEVNVRLYLEVDVNEEEAKTMIEDMEYSFEHSLIANTDLYNYEMVE